MICIINKEWWYTDTFTISLTSCFDYLNTMLRLSWHSLTRSGKTSRLSSRLSRFEQAIVFIEFASQKKTIFKPIWKHSVWQTIFKSIWKSMITFFQLHEMKTIDNIFAFSIFCFSVYTKSISILSVLVFVVLVLVLVLVLVIVLALCLASVLCSRLNQLDEQQALLSNSSSHHVYKSFRSERVQIARMLAMLSFRTLVFLQ